MNAFRQRRTELEYKRERLKGRKVGLDKDIWFYVVFSLWKHGRDGI
jgi:hypothetical protein